MSPANLEAAVIPPCLNEAETLQTVIVADNGSIDESLDIALKFEVRIISVKNKGPC
jgi:glycosyltransferase involved in cell wall biosynthesis